MSDMGEKPKLISEDVFRQRLQRKCGKPTLVKILALAMLIFLVLMVSLLYHAVMLNRIDQISEIMSLNLKHQHARHHQHRPGFNHELEAHIRLLSSAESVGTAKETAEAPKDTGESAEQSVQMTHARLNLKQHKRRDLSALFDPINFGHEPDFAELYSKVRNKRTKIALTKLEAEYRRCKKESFHGNDCINAFVKIYTIAKDISEKMERMKDMLKDSEFVLQQSASKSVESKEQQNQNNSKHDAVKIMEKSKNATSADETTAEPVHLPISWIIDGNDDYGEVVVKSTEAPKPATSGNATELETTAQPFTANTTRPTMSEKPSTSTVAMLVTPTKEEKPLQTDGSTAAVTETQAWNTDAISLSTAIPPGTLNQTASEEMTWILWEHSTDGGVTATAPPETTTTTNGTIAISVQDNAAVDTSTQRARTAQDMLTARITFPTTPEPIKFAWIIDSDVKSAELTNQSEVNREKSSGTTKPSSSKPIESAALHGEDAMAAPPNATQTTDIPAAGVHPLDYPSSVENMLDSFEVHDGLKLGSHASAVTSRFQETLQQADLIDSSEQLNDQNLMQFAPRLNPVNADNFGNHQYVSLCEHMANQARNRQILRPEAGADKFTPSPGMQFTSRGPGGFPVTGETMKASAQFMFNPNIGMPTIPVCFYVTPASFRMMQPSPFWMPSPYYGMPGNFGGPGLGSYMSGGGAGGGYFVPQSFGTTGAYFGHPSLTGAGPPANIPNIFTKNAPPQLQQPRQLFCTYMQNQAGASGSGGVGAGPNVNFKQRNSNQKLSSHIIYASYPGVPNLAAVNPTDQFKCELPGEAACFGGNECIRDSAWCDGAVDCSDGSDETSCTCRDRLASDRICDGYADCPMGEDEIGCFGCADFMHSCYNSAEEFERSNRSAVSMCYNALEKCDGITNCLNGKDELECSIIVSELNNLAAYPVSSPEGYLYRNYRGQWYPVCNNGDAWAQEACQTEGESFGAAHITFRQLSLPGPFIAPARIGSVQFPQACQMRDEQNKLIDQVSYVKCAPPHCGVTKKSATSALSPKSKRFSKRQVVATGRIVGGSYADPLEWPFVVALYRNGKFHCGGTIYSERWVISAAHCVINYEKYYYEVQAGVLRRSSFAPSTQIQPVSDIVVHQAYERRSMRNDMSLLRVAAPLKFNRWVKPICLPDEGRPTLGADWIWGPVEDTVCTVVGWGAVREKGPGSDHLREVTVPIHKRCLERDDQQSENVCAGDANGGRDACQGDSGGPLFCRSMSNPGEWYLAAIVSHGNGCGRVGEYGVYTRVALFLDWIERFVQPKFLPPARPLQLCPGYQCVWGGNRCISERKRCDRRVDCLGGEDEVGCTYNFIPDVGNAANVSTTTESDYHPESERMRETSSDVSVDLNTKPAVELNEQPPTTTEGPLNTTNDGLTAAALTHAILGTSPTSASAFRGETIVPSVETLAASSDGTTMMLHTTTERESETSKRATLSKLPTMTSTTLTTTSPSKSTTILATTTSPTIFITKSATPPSSTSQTTTAPTSMPPMTTSPTTKPPMKLTTESATPPSSTSQTTSSPTTTSPTRLTTEFATRPSSTSPITMSPMTTSPTTISQTTPGTLPAMSSTLALSTTFPARSSRTPSKKPSPTSGTTASTVITADDTLPEPTPAMISPISDKNSTATPLPPRLSQKFICTKIQQIIESVHRCDRILDCDDGTDEENCSCRDYLKGSLSVLICDGKPDCEDLTDEDGCGNCRRDEFWCPLSRTCVPLSQRCDDVDNCKFKEDEKDCVALTNGKELLLDANRQPSFSSAGIYSRNRKGVWRVVCVHETDFESPSQQNATANVVCSQLGFQGHRIAKTTELPRLTPIVPFSYDMRATSRLKLDFSPIVGDNRHFSSDENKFPLNPSRTKARTLQMADVPNRCLGIFIECNAASGHRRPLKTLSTGHELSSEGAAVSGLTPTLETYNQPNVFTKPETQPVVVQKKQEILEKLDAVIDYKKNTTLLVHDKLFVAREELHWTWLVDIYANGRLWCVGVLVNAHWVMVHESCYYGLRLNIDYVVALLGGGKSKTMPHKSHDEQLRRVDCFEVVPNSDVYLYHLDQPVEFTHRVLPAFLPDFAQYDRAATHDCIALLHDNDFGRIKSVATVEDKEDPLCRHSHRSCYKLVAKTLSMGLLNQTAMSDEDLASVSEEIELKSEVGNHSDASVLSQFTSCKQFGVKRSTAALDPLDQGVLVCRDEHTGWYPTALFTYNNTDCSSFKESFGLRTLEAAYASVKRVMARPQCAYPNAAPACETLRCPLGGCLNRQQLCDRHNDCHDASDESAATCGAQQAACLPSELRCRSSGKCIPKAKFCDHSADCEDLTDEPTICSCYTYLQATDPGKICDGIRNCWDKSDESPAICNCTEKSFRCSISSKKCVPLDFVCDQERDCPNGEDERYCYGIEAPLHHEGHNIRRPYASKPPQYGQLIEQSYGVWHTKCFPRSSPPALSELRQICRKLGYNPYTQPSYRLIDNAAHEAVETSEPPDQRGRVFSSAPLAGMYSEATKAVVVSKFSPLRLNHALTVLLKASRPIAELVRWNATDSSRCYRLEIKCG